MKQIDMQDRYRKNESFREYVDRYCKAYNRTMEEVLNIALVQEVERYYTDIEPKNRTGKSTYAPFGECM